MSSVYSVEIKITHGQWTVCKVSHLWACWWVPWVWARASYVRLFWHKLQVSSLSKLCCLISKENLFGYTKSYLQLSALVKQVAFVVSVIKLWTQLFLTENSKNKKVMSCDSLWFLCSLPDRFHSICWHHVQQAKVCHEEWRHNLWCASTTRNGL